MRYQYDQLFRLLFEPQTKGDKFFFGIGIVSGILGTILPFLLTYVKPDFTKLWHKIMVGILVAAFILFFLSFVVLAIRTVGRRAGKKTFVSQAAFTFWRVFLYLFLPSIVVTVVLLAYAKSRGTF